ncbi:MAG: virulence factor family protein [Pseudomonadaceae bacterium]|jgi:type IV secretory pathway VirJ component|nr:virulence factor family protein [Pseudomonadaceae bacterium]
MRRRYWAAALTALALVGMAAGLWRAQLQPAAAQVNTLTLPGISHASRVTPNGAVHARVLLALPTEQLLSAEQLLALSTQNAAQVLQYSVHVDDCALQQQQLQAVLGQLDGPPSLVAGIGPGAALAWRWLAQQPNDQAHALSIGFSIEHPDCPAPLPSHAAHGHWLAAWNDNPDDASARFVRGQPQHTENLISDYTVSLQQLLNSQLQRRLQGQRDPMPVVEVPATAANDTVTLFYSGDGGWRDLDADVAAEMAKHGYPVVGVDAMRYFWQHKSPEQASQDLSQLMQLYRQKWAAKHFVLAGYSFGADVLPALYNRLPAGDQQDVSAVLLLALARSGNFEIEVQGWLGKTGQEAPTGPELSQLPASKVLCVFGAQDIEGSGCTQPGAIGERLQLPGGHHFDENYPALAARLVKAIQARER